VLPGYLSSRELNRLARAYDEAVTSAVADDVRIGSTTTRVSDFVNRGAEFDSVYTYLPLLEACGLVIGRPFKLSSLHARTLRSHTSAQGLHVDVPHGSLDWPLVGFIVMIDAFRQENGATCFLPGSHRWLGAPEEPRTDPRRESERVLACGPSGSLLIFNGSVWHGHTANTSERPRRSLQGAFIPRDGNAGTDFAAQMRPETFARLSPLARQVLGL
jgi:hypothetical protein